MLEIDVMRCLRALRKRKLVIAIISALFLIIGFGLTLNVGDNMYTSSAKVYAAADSSYTEAANAVTAMNAYLDVATSFKISQRAALIMGRVDVDAYDVQKALSVNSSAKKSSTSSTITNFLNNSATVITFYATTTDPELSREIADAAAESYMIEMANILKYDAVKSLDTAELGTLSVNGKKEAFETRIKFMAVGFIFACLMIVACEVFDRKVRTLRDATIRSQLPIIGIIPDYKE